MSQVIASNAPGRKIHSIHGGVHPAENKAQSLQAAIKISSIPTEIVLPLSQHIGAPAKAIVEVGQQVLKGEMIAEAGGFVSVPVHASTSGEVTAIENRHVMHASGMTAPCIIIKPDGKDQWIEHQGIADYKKLDKAALVEIVRNAGIAGMGGAGFPAAVKLNTRPEQIIKSLIINGTECEPYITADDILMRERAEQIIQGALILQHIVNPSIETIIGVEDNKPEGITALRKAAEGTNIEIAAFPTKYPSGGEKQLIQILTGKEVPSGGLPAEIGVVCQNIGTTVAIYKAVTYGEPLISRITTVTGGALKQPQNYEVLLGTPFNHLLEQAGFEAAKAVRLISGGPMMGFTTEHHDVPVVKATNCILAPTEQELPTPPPAQACIRCGMCAEACPVSLLPQQMYWFSQAKNHDALMHHNLMDCIECGACSFSCPSNIPLVQYYRASKAEIRKANEEAKKAEYSMQRFEARQERLARAEAEKEAKRKERQEKAAQAAAAKAEAETAKTDTSAASISDDPVAAAIARAKAKADGAKVDPVEEAKAKLSSLEKRLLKAQDKLANAREMNDENLPAFESSVTKLEAKITEAKALIPNKAETSAPTPTGDPVADAIAKAQAKRTGGSDANVDPKEKLNKDIIGLKKRIKTSEEKLQTALDQGADTADAFKASIEKLQGKLEKAQAELAQLDNKQEKTTEVEKPTVDENDPVAMAIARAQAKRSGEAKEQNPKEKLERDIASLNKRINKAQEKLETVKNENPDKSEALETSLVKLKDKLAEAEKALSELED